MNATERQTLVRVSQFLAERYTGPGVGELRLEVDALLGEPVAECTECGQDVPVDSDPVRVPTDGSRVTADDVQVVWDMEGPGGVADWIRSMVPAVPAVPDTEASGEQT